MRALEKSEAVRRELNEELKMARHAESERLVHSGQHEKLSREANWKN